MKNTRVRAIGLTFLTFLFLIGLCTLTFKIFINSSSWALNAVNKHVNTIGLTKCGTITDRNNEILAQSKENKRLYNKNENTRKALLHTVGDNSLKISTAIQTLYRSELIGFNFITGIKSPEFLSPKSDIKLTLDSNCCKHAFEMLENKKGAVVVYNYKTGDILCMVSTPTYDPENPPEVKALNNEKYEGVYLNRVISSAYTPGSVFKVITSICAINNMNDIDNKVYNCSKVFPVNGKDITCLSNHQNLKFKDALMKSCNIYFAKLAIELGKDKMMENASKLFFNKSFKINKAQTKMSQYDIKNINDYQLGWSGIGQHNDLLNPMHMLIIMGAIANDGTAVMPNMISEINTPNSIGALNYQVLKKEAPINLMSKETANKIKDAMRYTVKNNYGDSMFPGLNVCAKTGTAEVGENKNPTAWMVGFSSNGKTPLAFVVAIEDSGYGIKEAGPIAKSVLTNLAK